MASNTDAVTIITKASQLLGDASQTYWLTTELLGWLNDGQLEIATIIPTSNNVTLSKQLVAGAKQSAPSDSIRIIEFVRNMGSDGLTAGNAIRQIERKTLSRFYPNWGTDTAVNTVIHAMYDAEDNNGVFYVWPPQPAVTPSFIELIYAQIPVLIANVNVGTKITVADYYQNVLLNYILFRALSRSTEDADHYQRSQNYLSLFKDELGIKVVSDNNANNDQVKQ